MKIEQMIEARYDQMNPSDHLIWKYISHHKEQCMQMTLHQLADACEVSHTTVLRFLQSLGIDGYREFKLLLKLEAQNTVPSDDTVIQKSCFNLNRTVKLIEQTDCSALFEKMDSASNLYIYGSGSVQKSAAKMLKSYFIMAEKVFYVIEGSDERQMALRTVRPGDVIFLISISGNNSQMNAFAKQMKKLGVYVVAICQDGANELATLCDFYLPFYTQKFEIGLHSSPYNSASGMFIVAEILSLKYISYQRGQKSS